MAISTQNPFLEMTKIGTWDWNLPTGHVTYSKTWARLLGYEKNELEPNVSTWESLVLPEDLAYANEQIEKHISGQAEVYEAEFRMRKKDGGIIWAQDRGRVAEYDEAGNPVRFIGVIQDMTRLKATEQSLRDYRESLDLAVNIASLGTWDWDLTTDQISYNNEYLQMLGYSMEDINGSMEEWENMTHPEDRPGTIAAINDYIEGKTDHYVCNIRMLCKDGSYLWTRDVGRIVARDVNGKPTRMIGGHLNIDDHIRTQEKLMQALDELSQSRKHLEQQVQERTQALSQHDEMLATVNEIAKTLLTSDIHVPFHELVTSCLAIIGQVTMQNRVYIWKDIWIHGLHSCIQVYEWVRGVAPVQGVEQFENVPYTQLPCFFESIKKAVCLNSKVRDLSESEMDVLMPQGIQSILIAPIYIGGKPWGFIGIDNCENDQLFSPIQESLLQTSGFLLASAIERNQTQNKILEMEERTSMMLNATPLCCNWWNSSYQNIFCNDEAVRLFELKCQQEYLDNFHNLSPEFQPDGKRSDEKAMEQLQIAFDNGYHRFEWMHQTIDGKLIPAEITLVRMEYKGDDIVLGFTRDLRELKAMLAEMHAAEADLRAAHEEALLSSQAKTNFLANMSHEIRTPMNVISCLAQLILRDSTDSTISAHGAGIKQACSNLLSIINDILDISKVESGKLEIVNAKYSVASLLNDVISMAEMRIGEKPLIFTNDIDCKIPAMLVGDEVRIKQILINFLSNAIKFTEEGTIALKVTGEFGHDKHIVLAISVTDTGQGIREKDKSLIFREFERVNTTKNRTIEGTGLGLALSKHLCEMMDGSISFESEFGVGSVFCATIPQTYEEYKPLASVDQPKTILVYESRKPCLLSFQSAITQLNCTCISCENQSELLECIYENNYDYIFTSSLHIDKVKSLMNKGHVDAKTVVFANVGESWESNKSAMVYLPVSCMKVANIISVNGEYCEKIGISTSTDGFGAPEARVLLVDDNTVNLKVAKGILEPYQMQVDTATGGREAIGKIQETHYDVVFMDHMMPEMDGIDTTIAIRAMEGSYYKNLPIIALTANAIVGAREMFLREGMNDFLAKPIETDKLHKMLRTWIPESKILVAASEKKEKETWSVKIEGVDIQKGMTLVGGNKDQYISILSSFYFDGMEKCRMLPQYLSQQDILSYRTDVHALKSTCAAIGATELSQIARLLEVASAQNDMDVISANHDKLIQDLSLLLQRMEPYVLVAGQKESSPKKQGDREMMKSLVEQLSQAIDFVQLSKIEDLLGQLQTYDWGKDMNDILDEISGKILVFDYDEAAQLLSRIQ